MTLSKNLTSHACSGKAIAIRLAEDGFDVCINDISANKAGIDEVSFQKALIIA